MKRKDNRKIVRCSFCDSIVIPNNTKRVRCKLCSTKKRTKRVFKDKKLIIRMKKGLY